MRILALKSKLHSESRVSELEHTVDGLSVTMQEQYIGGINYVQNSSGLNGIDTSFLT